MVWLALPFLAALTLAAAALRKPLVAGTLCALCGAVGLIASVTVLQSEAGRLWGVWAGVATAGFALATAGWVLIVPLARRDSADEKDGHRDG